MMTLRLCITTLLAYQLISAPIYANGCIENYEKVHKEFVEKEAKFWKKQKRKRFVTVRSVLHNFRDIITRSIKVFNITEYASLLTFDTQRSVITADRAANPNRTTDKIKLEGAEKEVSVDRVVEEWIQKYETFEADVKKSFEQAAYHESRYQALTSQLKEARLLLPKDLQALDNTSKGTLSVDLPGRSKSNEVVPSIEPLTTYDNLLIKIAQERNYRNSYLGRLGLLGRSGKLVDRINEQVYLHQQLLILKSRLSYYSAKPEFNMASKQRLIEAVDRALANRRLNPSYNQENTFFWKVLFAEAQRTVKRFVSSKFVKEFHEIDKQLSDAEKSSLGIGIGRTMSIAQIVSRLGVVTALFASLGIGTMNLPDLIFYKQRKMQEIAEAKTDAEYEKKIGEYMKVEFGIDYITYVMSNEHIPIHKKSQIESFIKKMKEIESKREIVQEERRLDEKYHAHVRDLISATEMGTDLTVPIVAESNRTYTVELQRYLFKHFNKEYMANKQKIDTWLTTKDKALAFKIGMELSGSQNEIYVHVQMANLKRREFLESEAANPGRSIGSHVGDINTEVVGQLYDHYRLKQGEDITP